MLGLAAFSLLFIMVFGYFPDEESGLFEGDIILDPDQLSQIRNGHMNGFASTKGKLWPTTIAYEFSSKLRKYDLRESVENIKRGVMKAFQHFKQHTCLRFVPRTFEREYILFYVGNSCSSHIGTTGGQRKVSLNPNNKGCDKWPVIVHELMHAIGFWHEQSRPDRDNYVKIIWENIYPSEGKINFKKYGRVKVDSLNVPYDLKSIMHYTGTAWSGTSRRITIKTLDPSQQYLLNGTRDSYGLSDLDVKQVNLLYQCDGNKPKPPPTAPPCSDFYDKCASYVHHCTGAPGSAMRNWMERDCKMTCGLCN